MQQPKQNQKKATGTPIAGTSTNNQKTKKIIIKKENKTNSGGFSDIHTGDAKTHPGVLKAQADKKKSDAAVANYAAKKKKS